MPYLRARFNDTCALCHGRIRPGQEIVWAKFSPSRHLACLPPAEQERERENRRPQSCIDCATWVAAGAGQLSAIAVGSKVEWAVRCKDRIACGARAQLRAEHAEREALSEGEKDKARKQLINELIAASEPCPIDGASSGRVFVLQPGGWPEGERRATEAVAFVETERADRRVWIVEYSGEPDGVWVHGLHGRANRSRVLNWTEALQQRISVLSAFTFETKET